MNPTCLVFFGLNNQNIDSSLLLEMIHHEDQTHISNNISKCISGGNVADIECRVKRGANQRWLRITPFLSNEEDHNFLVVQAEDITTVKANTEVLNNHNNKKNSILNILAHDLAGPLGGIQNYASLLERETKGLDNPRLVKLIGSIERLSKSGIHLIHTFLDQEFLESASTRLVKKRVDLLEKIKIALATYWDNQNEIDIKLVVNANAEKIYVEIDEDKFLQVINNLVSNALKFTHPSGVININIEEKRETVLISVSDTGIGIPKAFHDTLFEKFTNARRSGLKGEMSTGLGMSIIKTIVEWHDGRIWFDSEENIGTTFFIEIPLRTA
jgi:two-component system sensor histidine kinase VicK